MSMRRPPTSFRSRHRHSWAAVAALALATGLAACAGPGQPSRTAGSSSTVDPEVSAAASTAPVRRNTGTAAATALKTPTPVGPLAALPPTSNAAPTGLTPTDGGGGYTKVTIPGRTSGHTGTAYVWFPPGYTDPANARRTYPVIEVFHGFQPSPLATFSYFKLDVIMKQLVAAGKMREAIVVIPDWAPKMQDTECVDGGGSNVRMETWLTTDVPAWMATTYRTARDRNSWAGWGASTGGWCAMMAATLHPTTFGAAISVGGQGYPQFDPPYTPFTPESELGRRYTLTRVLAEQKPPVALWMLTSKGDKYSYPTSATMIAAAKPPTSVTSVVLETGRHHPKFWNPYVPESIRWLAARVPGFAAK